MNILALDLGTMTGWACADGSGSVKFDARLAKMERLDRHRVMIRRFHDWLCDRLSESQAAVIIMEDSGAHGNAQTQGAMRGVALLVADMRELIIETVSPRTWQAWARQNSDWAKGDEADAIAIRDWWLAVRSPRLKAA